MYLFDNIKIKIRIHFFVVGFGTSKSIHTGLFSSTRTQAVRNQDATHKNILRTAITYTNICVKKRWESLAYNGLMIYN